MAILEPGRIAPDFLLKTETGGIFSLKQNLNKGSVLLAFYKKSCPTCQMAFPYIERIHQGYAGENFLVLAIAQDPPADIPEFKQTYGLSLPTVADENQYATSKAFGLTNVPTLFLVRPDQKVEMTLVGWSKKEMLELSQEIAKMTKKASIGLFTPKDDVPDFKPG